jgi:hypothetical protein
MFRQTILATSVAALLGVASPSFAQGTKAAAAEPLGYCTEVATFAASMARGRDQGRPMADAIRHVREVSQQWLVSPDYFVRIVAAVYANPLVSEAEVALAALDACEQRARR